MLTQVAHNVGESTIMSRTGGAPTLAVGMATILSDFLGGPALVGIWYHFAILFEALFILTTVDAGTRVCRFMIQDLVGNVVPAFKATKSWANNIIGSAFACALWGYFLYQGVIDPLGGIWTMWPLFGTANQMLAAIALILCSVVLFKMKRERLAWVTIVPTAGWCCARSTAGFEKVFSPDTAVGFVGTCAEVRRRCFGGTNSGSREIAARNGTDRVQRLSGRRVGWVIRDDRADDGGLRHSGRAKGTADAARYDSGDRGARRDGGWG